VGFTPIGSGKVRGCFGGAPPGLKFGRLWGTWGAKSWGNMGKEVGRSELGDLFVGNMGGAD